MGRKVAHRENPYGMMHVVHTKGVRSPEITEHRLEWYVAWIISVITRGDDTSGGVGGGIKPNPKTKQSESRRSQSGKLCANKKLGGNLNKIYKNER